MGALAKILQHNSDNWKTIDHTSWVNTESNGELILPPPGFKLGDIIAKGQYGYIHHGTHRDGHKGKCAVKVLNKEESTKDAVAHEIKCHRLLEDNPRFVKMFDCCEDYTNVYLFMEYCEGGDLLTRLKDKGCFSERVSARIMRQLAEAVQECHKKGIMHRDVKPENVLLTDNSESPGVKLTDFGLSTFFSPGQKFLGEKHMVGTTLYAAPEVLKQLYSEEADVWSCGVTLYVMLCGRLPFNGNSEEEIFQAVLVGHLDLHSSPWHTIPDTAKEAVEGLLNRAPRHRLTLEDFLTHPWLNPSGGLSIFQKLKEMTDDNSFSQTYRRFSSSVSNSFRRTITQSFDGGSRPLVQAPTKFSSPAQSTQRSHTVVARVSG